MDPAAVTAYTEHFHTIDPWGLRLQAAVRSSEQILVGQSLIPHQEVKRTEYYADFGQPHKLTRSVVGIIEAVSPRASAIITVNRGDRSPEFDEGSTTILAALVPHLRRALALHRQLAAASAEQSALIEVIDRFQSGVLMVDAGLRVVRANRTASGFVQQDDGLSISGGHLRGATPAITSALTRALASAVAVNRLRSITAPTASILVMRPSGRRPFHVTITPLPSDEAAAAGAPAAALWIADPERPSSMSETVLRDAFGLTKAESRIAVALAGGTTTAEIAERHRLTKETTRWYVKQILAKTRTSTQAQAVRVLLTVC